MNEFTNEFELARNFGFDITMPDGNLGLSSAAHMEYMNKCTALYRNFLTNMSTIIRTEKETKKGLSKLHREKMENLRYSLYRIQNEANSNDPFAKAQEAHSVSHTGLDSRVNTPWGLGEVPHEEEEEKIRPHTAPAGTLKRSESVTKRKKSEAETDNNDEQLSTTGLSDPGETYKDEVLVGIIDAKTEKKIIVGQHSFAKLGNKSMNVRMKNRDGMFKVTPLKLEIEKDKSSTQAYDPCKPKADYDPVNEKLAMVKKETSYLTPTIASDMKINNKLPIQKTLKGLAAKRTTVVDIYRNSRDRRTRHFRIVSRMPKEGEAGNSGAQSRRPSRMAVARTKLFAAYAFSGPKQTDKTDSDSVEGDYYRERSDTMSTAAPRTSSRVAFAREDAISAFPFTRDNSRLGPGRPESQLSNAGTPLPREPSKPTLAVRSDSQLSSPGTPIMRERSDSMLSNSRVLALRDVKLDGSMNSSTGSLLERRMTKSSLPNNQDLPESFNSSKRGSMAAAVVATVFMSKLRKTSTAGSTGGDSQLGFVRPAKLDSNMDTRQIVKQQMRKDRELDENMTNWRRRMNVRAGAMSKSRFKPGGSRMKMI